MGAAHLSGTDAIGQFGQIVHLRSGDVAGRDLGRLERDHHGPVTGHLVRPRVVAIPSGKLWLAPGCRIDIGQGLVRQRHEEGAHAVYFGHIKTQRRIAQQGPLSLDSLTESNFTGRLNQDLDARLVDVVAPAFAVIDAQDRFQVGEQVLAR